MKSIFNKSILASFLLGAMLLLGNQSSAQCVADFNWSASGSTVTFKDSSTSNTTLYYYWQFGDGSYSSAQNPSHSYQKAGTYTTCLYVYDSTKSCVDSTCKQVTVASGSGGGTTGGCQAYFYATPSGLVLAMKNASKATTSNATYLWTFGDGDSSTQTHPSHTYASSGTYTVCLILTDSACSDTFCKQYTVSNAHSGNCTASFKYATSGNTVWVSNQSTAGQGNVTYTWTWGDGHSSSGSNPGSHNYAADSTYTICLVMYNSTTNCGDTDCQQVTVKSGNGSCKAYYTDSASGQLSFTFTNGSNTLNSGTAKYYWQYGDGSANDTNVNGSHTYAKAGTYNVCLKVKDGACYNIYCKSITVGGNQSTCQAWWADSAVAGSNQVYFYDISKVAGGTKIDYAWDFGDGNYSSQQNPNHTYSKTGTYYVCLTIMDSARACNDTRCDYITVGHANTGCAAKFVYSAQAKTVAFQNKSTGTSPNSTTCTWTFGDGSSATGYNTTHTYASTGTYTVCLYISDSNCSDSFCTSVYVGNRYWLKGTVSMGANTAPDYGKVWAIHYDSTAGTLTAIDSTYTDSTAGKYAFYLMPGYYLIKAALGSGSKHYKNFLPTYYNDKLHWDTANLVALFSNTQNINIHLIAGNNPGGPGFIGGYTSQGANKTGAVGDPVEGVEIVLYDDQKNPIAYTYSDSKGAFGFSNLKYGTYEVHPELLGKASTPLMVTISASKMAVSDVVVEVNSKYASVALGIVRSQQAIDNSIKVYPNPANSILNIEVEGNTSFLTTVTDMQGRSTGLSATQEGNRMRLDVSSLASGMYILNLTAKDGSSYRQRFVKQ